MQPGCWDGAGCCVGSTARVEALQRGFALGGCVLCGAEEGGGVCFLEIADNGAEVLVAFVGEASEEFFELVSGEAGERIVESGLHGGPIEHGGALVREAVEGEGGFEALLGRGEGIAGGLWELGHASGDLDGVLLAEPLGDFHGGIGGDGQGFVGGSEFGVGGREGFETLAFEADGHDLLGIGDDADTPFRACLVHDAIAELEGSGRGHWSLN